MPEQLSVAEILQATARQMWIDFEASAQLGHPGEKGRAREDVVRDFLRSYLPGRFGVDSGFVIDADRQVSKQMDIVIFDCASAPVFKISHSVRLFPIESVAAVLQVKSSLDGRELDNAVTNLRSALQLNRFAGKQYSAMMGGVMKSLIAPEDRGFEAYEVKSEPILTGIFAFRGAPLKDLAKKLYEFDNGRLEHRIPLMCVLDQGIVSYARGSEIAPYNAYLNEARLAFTSEADREQTLRSFYAMLAYGVSRKIPIAPSYRSYAGLQPMELDFADAGESS